ncbi:MAG: hypothetical protein R2877_06220 [Bdellovibrionota bacterium]
MHGANGNPILEWFTTLLLECTFLGFCIVFIGAGLSELKKKKITVKTWL